MVNEYKFLLDIFQLSERYSKLVKVGADGLGCHPLPAHPGGHYLKAAYRVKTPSVRDFRNDERAPVHADVLSFRPAFKERQESVLDPYARE